MKQEKENYCVCAVLEEISKKHGIKISQEDISKELTLSKKELFILNDEKIKYFLKELGFDYKFYWYNEIPFNEPDMLLKDMNNQEGFIGIGTHVYLLDSFNDPYLKVIDPKDCSSKEERLDNIMKMMGDKKGGCFGLIKKIRTNNLKNNIFL